MEKTLEITSKIDNLRIVESTVDELFASLGMDEEVYGNLLIAVMEAANNAISHGNKLDQRKHARFRFVQDEDKIVITVQDEGPGFDYAHVPDPTAPENLENITGRGIYLMGRLADELVFEDKGSTVHMTFFLKK